MKRKIFSILFAMVLAVSLMLVPAALVGAISHPGLVGLWHLDGNADDSSGNGNTGTLMSGASWTTSGMFGKALSLDGNGDYVDVPEVAGLNIAYTTVEMWIKPMMTVGDTTAKVLIDKRVPGTWTGEYLAFIRGNGEIVVRVRAETTDGYFTGAPGLIPMGVWSHIAFTWNGTTLRVYRNAVEIGTAEGSGAIVNNDQSVKIGARADLGSRHFFDGMIDEVRIWNGALGSTAIQQSYELGEPQSETDVVVKLKHKVLTSGEVVVFTSAFLLGSQGANTSKKVDIYIMSSSGDREIDAVGLRRVTPGNTDGNMVDSREDTDTHWEVDVTNGLVNPRGKTSTSIHLYAELDTDELLGVNAQYLP